MWALYAAHVEMVPLYKHCQSVTQTKSSLPNDGLRKYCMNHACAYKNKRRTKKRVAKGRPKILRGARIHERFPQSGLQLAPEFSSLGTRARPSSGRAHRFGTKSRPSVSPVLSTRYAVLIRTRRSRAGTADRIKKKIIEKKKSKGIERPDEPKRKNRELEKFYDRPVVRDGERPAARCSQAFSSPTGETTGCVIPVSRSDKTVRLRIIRKVLRARTRTDSTNGSWYYRDSEVLLLLLPVPLLPGRTVVTQRTTWPAAPGVAEAGGIPARQPSRSQKKQFENFTSPLERAQPAVTGDVTNGIRWPGGRRGGGG